MKKQRLPRGDFAYETHPIAGQFSERKWEFENLIVHFTLRSGKTWPWVLNSAFPTRSSVKLIGFPSASLPHWAVTGNFSPARFLGDRRLIAQKSLSCFFSISHQSA
ncbi:MAG: hypothetical protein AAF998_01350 [Bacteroidota bacterium]